MTTYRSAAASALLLGGAVLLGSCAGPKGWGPPPKVSAPDEATQLRWLDRVSWGATASSAQQLAHEGLPAWLQKQLHPPPAVLPAEAQARIDAMAISLAPVEQLVVTLDAQRRAADVLADEAQKKEARKAYQQQLTQLAQEARQRFVLRAL